MVKCLEVASVNIDVAQGAAVPIAVHAFIIPTVDDIDVTVCVELLAHFHFFQHNFAVVSFNTPAIIAVQPLADDAIAEADDLVRIIVLHV